MTGETPEPVTNDHVAFARDLVALARKHGANGLNVEFSLTSHTRFRPGDDRWNPSRTTFQWAEGRHGERQSFTLRAEAVVHITEKLEQADG